MLAAPADHISTTTPGGGYVTTTGTSNSTALIAGAAALVRARFPELAADEVIHRLTATANDKGPAGRDDEYGYGVINIERALTADVPLLRPTNAAPASAPPTGDADGTSNTGRVVAMVAALALVLVGTGWILARRVKS